MSRRSASCWRRSSARSWGMARLSSNWLSPSSRRSMSRPSATSRWRCSCSSGGRCCASSAPAPRQAWQLLPGVFVSNRGFVFPVPHGRPGASLDAAGARSSASPAHLGNARWARAPPGAAPARSSQPAGSGSALILGLPLLVFLAAGAPLRLDCAGAQRLQLRRRRRGFARIRGAADRAHHLYRQLHRRDRARRHPRGQLGAERGGDGARSHDRVSACG